MADSTGKLTSRPVSKDQPWSGYRKTLALDNNKVSHTCPSSNTFFSSKSQAPMSSKATQQRDQVVQVLNVRDLVLWTENPRDPIDASATDQTVVDRALGAQASKWSLTQLARDMGNRYDFSELPTVVYHKKRPVVYDGNRRIVLVKLKLGLVKVKGFDASSLPQFPTMLPCNVCTEAVALDNIWRKHAESGSWKPLERDIFLHKFRKEPKSIFLLLEENTRLISANPHLNQVFVKNEIFREDTLKEMGFSFMGDKLVTVHTNEQAKKILADVSKKVEEKVITTRLNRGRVLDVLDKESGQTIDDNKEEAYGPARISFKPTKGSIATTRRHRTRRRRKHSREVFGSKLYLETGIVNDLHRDICDLYEFYIDEQDRLSETFPNLIRMAMRLICEAAAVDVGLSIDKYVAKFFAGGKGNLGKDDKTFLATQNVREESLVNLLHTGAHAYSAASNLHQTIAISIVLGEMLQMSHGRS